MSNEVKKGEDVRKDAKPGIQCFFLHPQCNKTTADGKTATEDGWFLTPTGKWFCYQHARDAR